MMTSLVCNYLFILRTVILVFNINGENDIYVGFLYDFPYFLNSECHIFRIKS